MTDTRNFGDAVDITPRIENSPVMFIVKDFVESLYNDFNLDTRPSDRDIDKLVAFTKARKNRLVAALRELLADDAAILVMNKLPNDRARFIGTRRKVV